MGWSFMAMRDPHAVGVDGTLYLVRKDVRPRRMGMFGRGSTRDVGIAPIAVESYPIGSLSSSNSYDESGGSTLIEYMTWFPSQASPNPLGEACAHKRSMALVWENLPSKPSSRITRNLPIPRREPGVAGEDS